MSYSENLIQSLGIVHSIPETFDIVLGGKTIGRRISEAIEFREKGQFNEAMKRMAEANRIHVQAVRDVQKRIDELDDSEKTEVIFEKYRQKAPFQVGLINGDAIISLLNKVQSEIVDYDKSIKQLHDDEISVAELSEELHFYETRMMGRIAQSEVDQVRSAFDENELRIWKTKENCFSAVILIVQKEFGSLESDTNLRMALDLYLLITSSIETLHANDVDVNVENCKVEA